MRIHLPHFIAILALTLAAVCHAQTEPAHPVLAIPNIEGSTATANTILSRHPDETAYLNNFVPRQFPREDGFAPSPVIGDTNWS